MDVTAWKEQPFQEAAEISFLPASFSASFSLCPSLPLSAPDGLFGSRIVRAAGCRLTLSKQS